MIKKIERSNRYWQLRFVTLMSCRVVDPARAKTIQNTCSVVYNFRGIIHRTEVDIFIDEIYVSYIRIMVRPDEIILSSLTASISNTTNFIRR